MSPTYFPLYWTGHTSQASGTGPIAKKRLHTRSRHKMLDTLLTRRSPAMTSESAVMDGRCIRTSPKPALAHTSVWIEYTVAAALGGGASIMKTAPLYHHRLYVPQRATSFTPAVQVQDPCCLSCCESLSDLWCSGRGEDRVNHSVGYVWFANCRSETPYCQYKHTVRRRKRVTNHRTPRTVLKRLLIKPNYPSRRETRSPSDISHALRNRTHLPRRVCN
ncbi:uncharacterized protein B0H18DRAFT_671605 [Fomitopsis serialis]|uniref:uncharacterized protein n=1 Tax=Fomitopsis serialis TaxID=139415 RepID=UPI0020074AA9|nr:uncharacterized protein B0H18DRAFT_671605 [Neoantrodia serialis]KAH9932916.1 hypothetical protein B0H18DRAFT_671605 [Neoantrodia serialis]